MNVAFAFWVYYTGDNNMEETEIGEVGVDKQAEAAHEKAQEEKHRAPWLRGLALSSACFAVIAAGNCFTCTLRTRSVISMSLLYVVTLVMFLGANIGGFG